MTTYAFILGRKELLSITELINVFNKQSHIVDIVPEVLIATLDETLHRPQDSLNRLGGTVKIVEIFMEANLNADNFDSVIAEYLIAKFADFSSKLPYGLSAYNFSQGHEQVLKSLLTKIKKNLKKESINSRFINKNFTNLKTASIIGEDLINKGSEIVIIKGTNKIFIGETKAIQDIDNYSYRDYNRPHRDARLGMLPPKLAQIMINIGGLTKLDQPEVTPENLDKINPLTLFDPFAGIGTILTEGLLMGYSVIGSDINPEVIEKSQKNIDWTISNKNIFKQIHQLFVKDATTLKKSDLNSKVDLIVTESYLGPPQSRVPEQEEIKKTFHQIEEMIYRFLNVAIELIEPETPIVMSILAYRDNKHYHYINPIPEIAARHGYKVEPLIPHQTSIKFNLPTHMRESLIYDRPDQIVVREIFKFVKK